MGLASVLAMTMTMNQSSMIPAPIHEPWPFLRMVTLDPLEGDQMALTWAKRQLSLAMSRSGPQN